MHYGSLEDVIRLLHIKRLQTDNDLSELLCNILLKIDDNLTDTTYFITGDLKMTYSFV